MHFNSYGLQMPLNCILSHTFHGCRQMRSHVFTSLLLIGIIAVIFARQFSNKNQVKMLTKIVTAEIAESQKTLTAEFVFENNSMNSVFVTAVEKNCDCATVNCLPIEIERRSRTVIPVIVDCSKNRGEVERKFYFYTNPPIEGLLGIVHISKIQK